MANWLIVCKHLIENPKHLLWSEVRKSGKLQGYLCPQCQYTNAAKVPIEDLEPLSIDSIEALRGARQ